MRRYPLGPLLALVTLASVTLIGGQLNSVVAQGRVVSDWTGEPIKGAHIQVAETTRVDTDENGTWHLGEVPRGARLDVIAAGYGRVDFTVPTDEVRMPVATLTLDVFDDSTGARIAKPELRANNVLLRTGSDTGNIGTVHPGKGTVLTVCAEKYVPFEGVIDRPTAEIRLKPNGPGCPPLPSPSPSPSGSPEPSGSPAPSPTPSASP